MHDADPQAINALTRPDDGFEARDMKIAGLWKHIVGFFFFTAISIVFVALLYDFAIPKIYPDGGLLRARTTSAIIPPSPNPLIQSGHDAIMDINAVKQKESKETASYGWVDKDRGIAHIPVDKAMDLVARSGMNVTFSSPAQPAPKEAAPPRPAGKPRVAGASLGGGR